MELTDKRLKAIADMLPACDTVADIGTDHGKLGCYLLETGRCKRLWFSDISRDSLEKARLLCDNTGLSDKAEFCVGDGARPLPGKPDAAVIAGMGGLTIGKIISEGLDVLGNSLLVIEPNTHIYEARCALMRNGFAISEERCAEQSGRLYIIIAAKPGSAEYSFKELTAGPVLIEDRGPEARSYAAHRLKIAEAKQAALSAAGKADAALEEEIEIWKSLL